MRMVGAAAAVTLACSSLWLHKADAGEQAKEVSAKSTELKRVLDRVMAPPQIRTEQGFAARLLVPPGELYDPTFMRAHGNTVWVNDVGGQEPEKGRQGRIMAVDAQANVSTLVDVGRLWGPSLSFDIAPAHFAPYQGQLLTVSQSEAGLAGVPLPHIVQRIDPRTKREADTMCTLPPAGGPDGKGIPIGGIEGRFGPDDSPFAGKFFAATALNGTVYQVTPDGRCTPFVTFDQEKWGMPIAFAFSPDGQHLLVSIHPFAETRPGRATIARVRPDGSVEPEQLVRASPDKPLNIWGMAYAPAGFGEYAGQLFVATNNGKSNHQYKTQTVPEGGEVYRLTPEGELKLVASGFRYPVGVLFAGQRLWVSDIAGDFISLAMRELPDGFVVEITPEP